MTRSGLRVLVVEDSLALQATLATLFESHGHRADFAADGRRGLQLALDQPPDVLVLDLGLPGLDGLRVCRELRARADRHVPVLMLTARDAVADKLQGFDAGADDYLVKPFSGAELLARCVALSRRHRVGEANELTIGSLVIDRRSGAVRRGDRMLALNQSALHLLRALAEAYPRSLTRSELVRRLWGDESPPSDPLRTHLYLLRRELDPPGVSPMLRNVHGVGYRLETDL
ncbi:response regulator transcription factor [Lysobacter sp. Root983]|uniref:response regulator transcription factor n=1 Tax=Lysobacter sp. Root983 TaxID=1736613 RepID=UPI000708DC5B|nr:response regulator transcription factor [Lysobacter sp. Root983]KRD77228.1 XRE family transcriptional regulator [Lysobacter sp. Root983]